MADSAGTTDYKQLFQAGQYREALNALEQTPDARTQNALYSYNRGVMHYSLHEPGLAVAYLERARALAGGDTAKIDEPLRESRIELAKVIGESKLDPATTWIEAGEEAGLIPLVILALSLAAFAQILPRLRRLKPFFRSSKSIPFWLTVVLAFVALGLGTEARKHPAAMVVQSTMARSGPSATALERGSVEPGIKVRLDDTHSYDGWYRIRYGENGEMGFVPGSSLLRLEVAESGAIE